MTPYDTSTYLLDRANISDVCMRLVSEPSTGLLGKDETNGVQVHYYDTYTNGGEVGLRDRVFAETIWIDYTAFGLDAPRDFGRDEWVAEIGRLIGMFKATQHVVA